MPRQYLVGLERERHVRDLENLALEGRRLLITHGRFMSASMLNKKLSLTPLGRRAGADKVRAGIRYGEMIGTLPNDRLLGGYVVR